jgi:putative phage-type endonuclease
MPGRCRLLLPENAPLPEWLHYRVYGIGGSEVAALYGISPYATAFDVFKSKVDDNGEPRYLGPAPERGPRVRAELQTDNPILEWGHRLEQAVAVKTADEIGLVARPAGGLWQHLDHPVAIVTPDRIATKPRSRKPLALIECKTAGDSDEWEDGAPAHYEFQAQWQMGITGIQTCYLGCLVLGREREFFVREIPFDRDRFNEMVAVAERFWDEHVLTGEPPMFDLVHPRTEDLLKQLHPTVVFEAVTLPDEAAEWIEDYHRAAAELKRAERRLEECKNWLKVQLGDAGAGYLGHQKIVSYPEVHTTRISAKKLRAEFPEVAEECSETSSHRRLTVRPIKAVRPTTNTQQKAN